MVVFLDCPYGPMDKAPAYGAGDSGFESRYGLFPFYVRSCARGLVVMIVACQVMDPGSIPGERNFCVLSLWTSVKKK